MPNDARTALLARFEPLLITYDLAAAQTLHLPQGAPDPRRLGWTDPKVIAFEKRHGLGHYTKRAGLLRITFARLGGVTRFDADAAFAALQQTRRAAFAHWFKEAKILADRDGRAEPTRKTTCLGSHYMLGVVFLT